MSNWYQYFFSLAKMSGYNDVGFSRNHFTPHYSTPYKVERVTIHLKELNTTATIYPIFNINSIPSNLLKFLHQEYNDEVNRGDTLPFFDQLSLEEFQNYWCANFIAIMCIGDEPTLNADEEFTTNDWAKNCLGTFFIKSAYPGRCAHICTTNFLVNAGIRRHRIGFYLCECFLRWAPILGYSRCIIELVFETNIGAKKLLEKCGFNKVGKINACAILKSTKDLLINSLIYTKDLPIINDDLNVSKHANILVYLLSGKYPENSTRDDRSRLRALAYHYNVVDNKLFLKDKQVIFDPNDQISITKKIHEENHMGINRTTKKLSSSYYWSKIKQTVKKVVDECEVCKKDKSSESANQIPQNNTSITNHDNDNNNTTTRDNTIATNNEITQNNSNKRQKVNSNQFDIPMLSNQWNQSPENAKSATRMDTMRIETPDDLLRQSETAIMNLININNSQSSELQPRANKTPNDDTTDLASMLNYYNSTNPSQLPSSSQKRTRNEFEKNSYSNNLFYNQFQMVQDDEEDDGDYNGEEDDDEEDDEDDDEDEDDQAEEVPEDESMLS